MRRKLLTFLGGAVASMRSGAAAQASARLAEIPQEVLVELLRTAAAGPWGQDDLAGLCALLAQDERRPVRLVMCELFERGQIVLPACQAEPLLARLASDRDPAVRTGAARALAGWLPSQGPADQARVLWSLARSVDRYARWVVAVALARRFRVGEVVLVLAVLSRDGEPMIRRAVARAAAERYDQDPVAYRSILRCLADDPKRQVRRGARRAMTKGLPGRRAVGRGVPGSAMAGGTSADSGGVFTLGLLSHGPLVG